MNSSTERQRGRNHRSWPCKNLGELINFLEEQNPKGLNISEIAKRMGCTPQHISALLLKDEMKLSYVEKIARSYGHELKLYFPVWTKENPSKSKDRSFPTAGNLTGLAKYIYDSNRTVNSVSTDMNKPGSIMEQAFRKGDIKISTLYEILAQLNIITQWKFEKKS